MRNPFRFLQGVLFIVASLLSNITLAQDEYTELNLAYTASPTVETAREGNWHGLLGAGVIVLQQPVADTRTFVLPLVALSYRDTLYWRFGQAGVYVLNSEDRRARLAIAIKARRGYDPADYAALAGMDKRATSVEAGIHGTWLTHASLISYGVFTDISNKSDGNSAQLNLAHPFRLAPRWHLIPSLGAEWLSDKVVDYYFGVKPGEATLARPAYVGTASVNLRVGVMLHHRVSREWSLFGGVSYTRLGTGISDSPIVTHEGITALHFGGGWHF